MSQSATLQGFACIRTEEDLALVQAAGFAGVVGPQPALMLSGSPLRAWTEGDCLWVRRDGTTERWPLIVGRTLEAADIEAALAAGSAGLVLSSEEHLLGARGLSVLARAAGLCHAAGLRIGFGGGLEAPDVPRLRALEADLLLFGRALRGPDGRLSEERMAAIAALLRGTDEVASSPVARPSRRDRIFVRDLVQLVSIGAYVREHGRKQRVRFSVEAEIEPATGRTGLDAVVSYDLITDAIDRLTADRHVELVETLAEEIAATILGVPRVAIVRVSVEKLDLGPGAVGVEIERSGNG